MRAAPTAVLAVTLALSLTSPISAAPPTVVDDPLFDMCTSGQDPAVDPCAGVDVETNLRTARLTLSDDGLLTSLTMWEDGPRLQGVTLLVWDDLQPDLSIPDLTAALDVRNPDDDLFVTPNGLADCRATRSRNGATWTFSVPLTCFDRQPDGDVFLGIRVRGTDGQEDFTLREGLIRVYDIAAIEPNRPRPTRRDVRNTCADGNSRFSDVSDDGTFLRTIACLTDVGIVAGYGDGTYRPTQGINLSELAAFLLRTLEEQDVLLPPYDDCGTSREFQRAMSLLVGYDVARCVDRFEEVTRVRMAEVVDAVARLGGGIIPDTSTDWFADDEGFVYGTDQQRRINTLAAYGVVVGDDMGRYRPASRVTRGQMSAYIARVRDLIIEEGQYLTR